VAHDKRRHELDIHLLEVEDLREALATHRSELQKTESDRARIAAQKEDIAQIVAALEADLRRVRKDAETFGRDLRLLRAEKENATESLTKAERAKKQAQAQIRVLKEQIATLMDKKDRAEAQISNHVCSS
jgi:chromosome segregation ATPase